MERNAEAVDEIAPTGHRLLDNLVTHAPAKDGDAEAAKTKARFASSTRGLAGA